MEGGEGRSHHTDHTTAHIRATCATTCMRCGGRFAEVVAVEAEVEHAGMGQRLHVWNTAVTAGTASELICSSGPRGTISWQRELNAISSGAGTSAAHGTGTGAGTVLVIWTVRPTSTDGRVQCMRGAELTCSSHHPVPQPHTTHLQQHSSASAHCTARQLPHHGAHHTRHQRGRAANSSPGPSDLTQLLLSLLYCALSCCCSLVSLLCGIVLPPAEC